MPEGGLKRADARNQSLYTTGDLSRRYVSRGRWLDAGEEASLAVVAAKVRGGAILDIGMGAGRTTSLLRLLSDDYTGLDYSRTMVERARQAYPESTLAEGDARDLSRFPDNSFDLVVFSYNGIDSVDHQDRALILREFHRVLKAGSPLVFSTLNKDGPYFREPPWRTGLPSPSESSRLSRLARLGARVALRAPEQFRLWSSWWRLKGSFDDRGEWAMGPLGGAGAGLIVHWTTVPAACDELAEAGFEVVALYSNHGHAIDAATRPTDCGYFHVVAQAT